MIMNKKFFVLGSLILIVIVGFMVFSGDNDTEEMQITYELGDPIDATLDFYNTWLVAMQSTTSNPYDDELHIKSDALSQNIKDKIITTRTNSTSDGLDPILCQMEIPERIGAKVLYQQDSEAQIMVLARGWEEKSPFQAVVTLQGVKDKWIINDINCVTGELPPTREYDFEKEGYLLKSVPPPLDSNYWHLVFEQNGQSGHTVPLFFTANSVCIYSEDEEKTCVPDEFTDATKVYLQAGMTEVGATVERLYFNDFQN